MITLRDYQIDIINKARTLMKSGIKSMVIVSPTGSGKTALVSHMMKSAAEKKMHSFFICHRRELIKQSMKSFDKCGVYHGVIAAGFMGDDRPYVNICSIQTLASRLDKINKKPMLICWDEGHHVAAGNWTKIYKAFPNAFHIFVTATPARHDGRGLGEYAQEMILGPSVRWLIDNKYLCDYKMYAPSRADLSDVHTRMGDYKKDELTSAMDKPSITGNAIKEYRSKAMGKRALVFATSIQHSKHVVEEFISNGIPAAHIDGEMNSEDRDRILAQFEKGKILVLSNVEIATEGWDCPALEAVILLRPTKSLSLYLQMVGRVLRLKENGAHAVILDHANLAETHGLPDEAREWSLIGDQSERRSKKDAGMSVKVCEKCFAAQPSGATECMYCHFVFEVKSRKIEEIEGDLKEITAEELQRRREIKNRRSEQGQSKTYEDLVALGKRKGYKSPEKWARIIVQSRALKGRI